MSSGWLYCLARLLIPALLCSGVVLAQELGPPPNSLVGERPNVTDGPTQITVGVYFLDIDEIDDVKQQFSIDMFFRITWRDPRLALPEDQRTGQVRIVPRDKIWNPKGMIINDRGLRSQLPLVVEVDDLGNVRYRQRVTGALSFESKLQQFPFDSQTLLVDFVSYAYTPEEIEWAPGSGVIGDGSSITADGWELRILEPEFSDFTIPGEGVVRPRLTYLIEAKRDVQYYLLTLFLPMSLIIFMSWTAFWLQPDIVPPRIAISTASIFSLIAFGFSIRLSLPRVSYVTIADVFVIGCMLMVFLALGVAVIGSRMASAGQMNQALRLNAIARWTYFALYCLLISTIVVL
jgi:hypothetical protein